MVKIFFRLTMILSSITINAQNSITIFDFENKPNVGDWWKDNTDVKISLDETPQFQINDLSKVCLHIQWDSIPAQKSRTWFTDIKLYTFNDDSMTATWKNFKEKTWVSFWCNSGSGDTLWMQLLLMTKNEEGKWGSHKKFPVKSGNWQFFKFQLASVEYENWGKLASKPDLGTNEITKFEVGLINGNCKKQCFVNVRFDNFKFTNYEPMK